MMKRRRLVSLPLLVHAGPVLFLFLSLTSAEKRVSVPLGTSMTLESGTVSSTLIVGQIHGMGNVDLAHVILDWNSSSSTDSTANIDKSEWVTVAAVAGLSTPSHVPSHTQLMTWALDATQLHKYLVDELGIGAFGRDSNFYGCCTRDALQQGLCDATQLGHLILGQDDHDVGENTNDRHIQDFSKLQHRNISADPATNKIWYPYGLESILWVDRTRPVVLVFANCWQEGNLNTTTTMPEKMSVQIHGSVDFVSEISPRTIPLYLLLTICHVGLVLWYRRLMQHHAATRIAMEDWIFTVLVLATVAVMVQTLLYTLQAYTMESWLVVASVGVQFLSSSTRAVSRCLYLVLAMGMGVITTTPTLRTLVTTTSGDCKMIMILVLLGLCLWSELVDALGKLRGYHSTSMSIALTLKEWLYGLLWIWIPYEICKTLRHLEYYQKEEPHKAERYQYIWKIYLFAVGLTLAQYGVLYMDVTWNGARDFTFVDLQEMGDCIYVILLTSIAYLWRPNPSQVMYAYQLLDEDTGELSSAGNNNHHTLSLELCLQDARSVASDDNGETQEPEVEFRPP